MNNWAQQMHENGVVELEMSLKDLQNLLIQGEITEVQFAKILMDNLDEETFIRTMQEVLKEFMITQE